MKKKILLYFPTDITKQANQSVYKKFLSQIKGFEKCGMDVDYIFHSGTDIIFNNEPIKFKYNISKKIISKLNPIIGYLLYFFSARVVVVDDGLSTLWFYERGIIKKNRKVIYYTKYKEHF